MVPASLPGTFRSFLPEDFPGDAYGGYRVWPAGVELRKSNWNDSTRVLGFPDPDQRTTPQTHRWRVCDLLPSQQTALCAGAGVPRTESDYLPAGLHRYELPGEHRITRTSILGGLHHDYRLEKEVA